ncbi:pectin lyase fold/virulence factor [Hypoxylon rubiginosum]|uniref:Pectin lyase fold/virulence factor n=1 Tax=Hypoxylon rubiginosum TaxID=110542 RepID=A0ACB9YLF6_9PEZI|nr:pectin lyase fold/virulence factor [Hypoxylon rubiginosum]
MRAFGLVFGVGNLLGHAASLAFGPDATIASRAAASTVVVSLDGTGQFTSIDGAITYAQQNSIATVSVKAGTYNETIVINRSPAVTIVGDTSFPNDYTQNQVIITSGGVPLSINTNNVEGITWRNINFVSLSTSTTAWAVSLRGTKNAFYGCQIISAGNQAFYSTLGITLIANSYVEAVTQVFSGYLGLYVFNTTITATADTNGIILFNKGLSTTNSTVVFDGCTITQKITQARLLRARASLSVYLAAPNGNYAQGIWLNTFMSDLIIPQGIYNYPSTSIGNFFAEFNTRGPGSYLLNICARSDYDHLLDSSQLAPFTIARVFADSFPAYATVDLSWIDAQVLLAISATDDAGATATQSSVSYTCAATTQPTTTTTTIASNVVTQTSTSTITVDSDTVTPDPIVTTASGTSATTTTTTVTVSPDPLSTRTQTTTVTTTQTVTSTVASQTTTQIVTQTTGGRTMTSTRPGFTVFATLTITITGTITPDPVTRTRTVATSTLAGPTTITTGRPVTRTVVVLIIVRRTVVTTTTLGCTPRGFGGWRGWKRTDAAIQARATPTVFSPTVVVTVSVGSTTSVSTQTETSTVAGTTTLAPSTTTVFTGGPTSTVTTTSNIRQSRVTVTTTRTRTAFTTVTITAPTATATSTTTVDTTTTTTGGTTTSTVSTTSSTQTTLVALTLVNRVTLTITGPAVTSSVPGPTVSSRTTETSTQVVTSTVTQFPPRAPFCR